jgi:ornithine cyclodeaminase
MMAIDFEEIKNLVRLDDLFEPVRQSFIDYSSGKLLAAPVNLLHFKDNSDAHIKIAAVEDCPYFSIKVATMYPHNTLSGLPVNNGAIFLFNAQTGALAAILQDKGYLTDMRTAVAGASITDLAAPKTAKTLAVIGTGIQAQYQVLALKKLRAFDRLMIYGRDATKAALLKDKLKNELVDVAIHCVKSEEEAVKDSEMIITTTSSTLPLIKGNWLVKGQHITAVGADDTYKRELDTLCFEYADEIYLDSLHLNKQYGEFSEAVKQNPSILGKTSELGQLFLESDQAQTRGKTGITIAKLVGLGVQDLAAATVVMNKLAIVATTI